MKRNFTHESFERFLKQSTDQLRMHPSKNVWENIQKELNRRRRRVVYLSGLFLVAASIFGYYLVDSSQKLTDAPSAVNTNYTVTPLKKREAGVAKAITSTPSSATQPATIASGTANPILLAEATTTASGSETGAITETVSAVPATENETAFESTVVDEYVPFSNTHAAATTPPATKLNVSEPFLTIESVLNSYKKAPSRKKAEVQLTFAPTISYRKLTENKAYLQNVPQNTASVNLAALYDVNNAVTHKPDMGLEMGIAVKYPVTKNIKLRTGLQFNLNRYDIKAFTYVPEVATIALNNSSRRRDSINTVTNYRNFTGGQTNWLQNMYFQLSAPVGAEFKLAGDEKRTFGIAATIQPTYVLGDRAYLISTDYKNYSQVPWLVRRWNVNTSVDAFVGYSTGKLNWQVGPQIRYQLLSSFATQYPVKENLFDFGFKVGLSLNRQQQ